MSPATKAWPRWSWAWTPFLVIGVAVIPNLTMIAVAGRHRPEAVEEQPYLRSALVDADKAAAARGARRALVLRIGTAADGTRTCHLDGEAAGLRGATLACWRPDDGRLDRTLAWGDPTVPLALPPARRGRWRLHLTATGADGQAVACSGQVHLDAGAAP